MKKILYICLCLTAYSIFAVIAFATVLLPFALYEATSILFWIIFTPLTLAASIFIIFAAIFVIQTVIEHW